MPGKPWKPGDKRATDNVCRWLQKDHPDYPMWYVHERLDYSSLELFIRDAKGWLGDRSELGYGSLDNADWEYVYGYFKEFNEK